MLLAPFFCKSQLAQQMHKAEPNQPINLHPRPRADRQGIMASLPHREFITVESTEVTPPMMQATSYPVFYPHVLKRVFAWCFAGSSYLMGNLWDALRGRNTEARRADRLRHTFEKTGGTFKKIGRLLAMRIDLLPWAYCVELSKIIDDVEPIAADSAIDKIEKATGKPLAEVFSQFDPDPIVSNSVACVYQAVLRNGTRVAVKVRRPKIGELFMADLKALDWLLSTAEFLSILRPGFTTTIRRELREDIEDELNFQLEARHQDLFRREAKKSGKKFFTAPRLHFNLCSQEVIIQDFTVGMWLWELLAAIEQNDEEALARAEQLNIDPELVAKRLLWVNFWGLDEHILFRADLHPDEVIVGKNSRLTFIDFSSVGALSSEKRQAMQLAMYYAWKRDPLEMAQASMVLLEPLPPIDTIKFTKDLESNYWQFLYAIESKHIEWWERTSARLWLGFVKVAREHNVTMNIHVLRLIRACLLNDTVAARLSPKIDHVKEYQKFSRYRAKRARERVEERLAQQFQDGLDGRVYLQFEELTDTSERLFRQLQRVLSTPVLKFNAVLDKSVYSLSVSFRFLGHLFLVTLAALGITYSIEWINNQQLINFADAFIQVISNQVYLVIILLVLFINIRTILFRLGDKEV